MTLEQRTNEQNSPEGIGSSSKELRMLNLRHDIIEILSNGYLYKEGDKKGSYSVKDRLLKAIFMTGEHVIKVIIPDGFDNSLPEIKVYLPNEEEILLKSDGTPVDPNAPHEDVVNANNVLLGHFRDVKELLSTKEPTSQTTNDQG